MDIAVILAVVVIFLVVYSLNNKDPIAKALGEINKLIKNSKTPENKQRITRLMEFHNLRVKAGANVVESLRRLDREIRELTGQVVEKEQVGLLPTEENHE